MNPLKNPWSDQHLISPNINAAESFIKIIEIKEMITNLRSEYWSDLHCNELYLAVTFVFSMGFDLETSAIPVQCATS